MPLLISAIGAMFSELSGIVNIALEGIMILGAFSGILFINQLQDKIHGQTLLLIAILISALVGIFFSLIHGYASIKFKANQIISGTAINLFAPAFSVYISRMIFSIKQISFKNQFIIKKIFLLNKIPFLGEIFFTQTYITVFISFFILFLSWLVVYKTRFGLRLRACGENPNAADIVGIEVSKMQYIATAISGALAGVSGLTFIIPTSTQFDGNVAGYGFLALAVLIFGQWRPDKILFASFLFGFLKAISTSYSEIMFLKKISISSYFYKSLPYIIILIVLIWTSKNTKPPNALGKIYDSNEN
jgi:simple sugar transport system permease protein